MVVTVAITLNQLDALVVRQELGDYISLISGQNRVAVHTLAAKHTHTSWYYSN